MADVDIASSYILFLSILGFFSLCIATESDISCLKSIKDSLEDPHNYLTSSWNFTDNFEGFICYFKGVECWYPAENRVLNLRLSDLGLKGQFPRGLENCTSLTGLDLSNNDIYGPLPLDIHKVLPYVTSLDLSFNQISGKIPPTVANCSNLNLIKLDHNQLSGRIPEEMGQLRRLKTFSVANNQLSGRVPNFVGQNFSADSYANNLELCGEPLDACEKCVKFSCSFRSGFIIGYVVFVVSTVVVIVSYFLPWFHVGKKNKTMTMTEIMVLVMKLKKRRIKNGVVDEEQKQSLQRAISKPQKTKNEISDLEKTVGRISLVDLSNATENFCPQNIIGIGRTGTVYKATLPNGWFLAVKKFRNCQNSENLFITELKTFGVFRHDNLLPILGFCKESNEQLLVYKYMSNGNLFDWLHSADGEEKILEWPMRLKIALGLARGIAWLHHGCNFKIVHHHQNISLKSVLLDQNFEPKLSNFEKATLMNTYSSNDFSVSRGIWDWGFVKRDVFNFGVVLLELLTGKEFSSNSFDGRLNELINGFSSNLYSMYNTVDKSIMGKGNDGDIFQLLTLATSCVHNSPEKRPSMLDAYKSIAEIGTRYGLTLQTEIAPASSRYEHTETEIEEIS